MLGVIGIIQDELLYLHNVLLLIMKRYIVLLILSHIITCLVITITNIKACLD